MAWDIPAFAIPVQVNQSREIGSWADRLMGAYDQGRGQRREQDILTGRKALGEEMAALPPGAQPNNQSYAARLLGNGDLEGANTFMRLGQQEVQNNFERERIDLMRRRVGEDGKPKFSLTPQYGLDGNNNPVLLQMGSDGTVRQSPLPPGVSLSGKPLVSDAGTHFVLTDPITRQPITTIPKNVSGVARETAVGKASGEAQAQLPGAEGMAGQITKQIEDLATDPKLPDMLGPLASRMPNVSADAARVQARMDQLQGGVFLQGYQMLKGGGAITEVEGLKAENAMARLSAAQNVQDYTKALRDFGDALTVGLNKLRAQAAMVPGGQPQVGQQGQGGGQPAANGAQQPGYGQGAGGLVPGTVVKGFIYRGGNPKDPNSWGRAQ